MSLADELHKLEELRARGVLSQSEFDTAKARLLGQAAAPGTRPESPQSLEAINAFRRSTSDRWIGGVCGGLARSTGLESWVWRLIFAVLLLFGGTGFVLYLLLWIFVPTE